ncbi:MAG TPA: MBL fold metallo-hydrolase, partial [Xanthobacteraceae bacterium]|nr:MBL fold metallo-hydrolase [Xanthobacteraceae bacterium]
MPAQTRLFLCLKDNYGVLLHDPESGATAAIDAPEAAPVEAVLKASGWRLTDILVTHHHADHTGGIAELKQRHRCRVVAPHGEAARIPLVDATVREDDEV